MSKGKKEHEIYDESFTSHYMRRGFEEEKELLKEGELYRQIPPHRPPGRRPGRRPQGRPPRPGQHRPPHGPGSLIPPLFPGGHGSRPPGPPPKTRPKRRPSVSAVDPRGIRRCLYSFTYMWMDNGREFWAFPIYVGRRSMSGFRWTGFNWVYFGTDLKKIDSFICL